ncbi:MAG: hypothetical protein PHR26_03210 [Candidatus ainarchaeum sp.]|nr:hypothetical protein [Candidatus ainarchaeum sp.]
MKKKIKLKGQVSIEVLAILGVLIIGAVLLGVFYLNTIYDKMDEGTDIGSLTDGFDFGFDDEPGTPGGPVVPTCDNDGVRETGEECDGSDFGSVTCSSFAGYIGDEANLICNDCEIDFSSCEVDPEDPPVCGDNLINQASEVCDDSDFDGKTCEDYTPSGYYFVSGSLECRDNCTTIDTSNCKFEEIVTENCGNGILDSGEECDYNGQVFSFEPVNCQAYGLLEPISFVGSSTAVTCTTECRVDTSSCLDPEVPGTCDQFNLEQCILEPEVCKECSNEITGTIFNTSDVNCAIAGCCGDRDCTISKTLSTFPYVGNYLYEIPQGSLSILNGYGESITFGSNTFKINPEVMHECEDDCDTLCSFNHSSGVTTEILAGELVEVCQECYYNNSSVDCCGNGICSSSETSLSCPIDCNTFNPQFTINSTPSSLESYVSGGFNVDVSAFNFDDTAMYFGLKLHVYDTSTNELSNNCSYDGTYSSVLDLGSYSKNDPNHSFTFVCNTIGDYEFKFVGSEYILDPNTGGTQTNMPIAFAEDHSDVSIIEAPAGDELELYTPNNYVTTQSEVEFNITLESRNEASQVTLNVEDVYGVSLNDCTYNSIPITENYLLSNFNQDETKTFTFKCSDEIMHEFNFYGETTEEPIHDSSAMTQVNIINEEIQEGINPYALCSPVVSSVSGDQTLRICVNDLSATSTSGGNTLTIYVNNPTYSEREDTTPNCTTLNGNTLCIYPGKLN